MSPIRHFLRMLVLAGVFGLVITTGRVALAGEIKLSNKQIETDKSGKITGAGRKATVSELKNVPGEDEWIVHVWAKIDKGAPGPLYVEFHDKWQGKPLKVWHHEDASYEGDRYVSFELSLEGNHGFNKDHTYSVRVVQQNAKGKDVVLASGAKVKLVKVQEKEDDKKEEEEEETEGEEDVTEQDVLDSFAGGEGAGGDGPPAAGSGPGAKKKGCKSSIDAGPGAGLVGLLVLFALGAGLRARPRSRR